MTDPLLPNIPIDSLLPADAALMARTDLQQTRLLNYSPVNIDSVTSILIGLMGRRPAVRHVSVATHQILRILETAGLEITEDMRLYEAGAEAEAAADDLIETGYRLLSPYPLPEGRYPDNAQIVPPSLWRRLNSKERLGDLIDASYLPPREILTHEKALQRPLSAPVWLKAAGEMATGWGYAVRHCEDAAGYASALDDMRSFDVSDEVIVEEHVPVSTCWCTSIVVQAEKTLYAGSAEQTFSRPGQQVGSLIDPANPMPDPALAIRIGEAARRLGFRGLAGFDIGRTADGRMVVFDPNFRVNSSTTQVLLHDAAASRAGLTVSLSVTLSTALPMAEIARRLQGPIDDKWFVPTRLLDADRLVAAKGKSIVVGFVLGDSPEAALAAQSTVGSMLQASGY